MKEVAAMMLDMCRVIVATMAAWVAGRIGRRIVGLPMVLSYILIGLALGPEALGLVKGDSIKRLWWFQGVALSFIGFVAACEFFWKGIEKPKSVIIASVKALVAAAVVVAPAIGLLGVVGFPWLKDLDGKSLAVASLVFSIMAAARAPSVTVAVISELQAAGPFSSSVLQVVIVSGVFAIIAFAVNNVACSCILAGTVRLADVWNIAYRVIGTVALGTLMAAAIRAMFIARGVLVKTPMRALANRTWRGNLRLILRVSGLVVIGLLAPILNKITSTFVPKGRGIDLGVDVLLCAIWGGFIVTNWTKKRAQLSHVIGSITPQLFAVFFVMTGAALDTTVIRDTAAMVPVLLVLRVIALFLAHLVSFRSRNPMRKRALIWLGHISQGGITVSLAAQLPAMFPTIGRFLATACLAALLVNTLVGPLLLKVAIRMFGEAGKAAKQGNLVLVGCDAWPLMFAARLVRAKWKVLILDTSAERLRQAREQHSDVFRDASPGSIRWDALPATTPQTLSGVGVTLSDSLIVALPSDDENYAVASAAVDMGLTRVLVKLADATNVDRFLELHVLVFDMTSAMLDWADLSIQPRGSSAALEDGGLETETTRLLSLRGGGGSGGGGQSLRSVRVLDSLEEAHGRMVGDLVLPGKAFVSAIIRGTSWIVPTASTRVVPEDRFVIVGDDSLLQEITDDYSSSVRMRPQAPFDEYDEEQPRPSAIITLRNIQEDTELATPK